MSSSAPHGLQIDERRAAAGDLRQMPVPFLDGSKLEDLFGNGLSLEPLAFRFGARGRDLLLGFDLDALQVPLRLEGRLLGG